MATIDEETLWKHWMYLKNELHVEDLVEDLVKSEVFTQTQQNEILHVSPNTRQMKAEKFLKVLIQSGEKGFDKFCEILTKNRDNRHQAVIDKLNLTQTRPDTETGSSGMETPAGAEGNTATNFRPESSASATSSTSYASLPSHDGETGEKNIKTSKSARRAWRSDASVAESLAARQNDTPSINEGQNEPGIAHENSSVFLTSQNNLEPQGAASISLLTERQNSNIDMTALEQELLRLAPTIADVFQRISQSTTQVPVSEEEIKKVKEDNERLRKTNRTLIEKLNTFQQRIIRLQVENKNLREAGEGAKETRKDLDKKAVELEAFEKRIEDQKTALEEKEKELKIQLQKIQEIEENMSKQRDKIQELSHLYDEGVEESCRQQEEIIRLQEERENQDAQIGQLEYKQRVSNEKMKDLEERLEQLEKTGNRVRGLRRSNPRGKRILGMMSDMN